MDKPDGTSALGGVLRDVRLAFADIFSGGKLDPTHELTIEVFFGLLGALAQADGLVTSEEAGFANQLMDQLELTTAGRQLASGAFERGRRKQVDVDAEVKRFLARFPVGSPEVKRLYDNLVRLAAADSRLRPGERVFLERMTVALGFRAELLDVKLKQFMPGLARNAR
jgi:DnaJ like chaperone protein